MNDLIKRIREGDTNALARAINIVESDRPDASTVVRGLSARGDATVLGVTGPPGSGKSTLSGKIVERWRARDERVGVLAVDPSSPYSQGSLMGDRIRMQQHSGDEGVFIRSMAARGHLGGLAVPVRDAIRLLVAGGRTRILLETVGVGQSELEVMETADTTVVVLPPIAGDAIQAMKAGILEIADVFVVNKADVPDSLTVRKDLRRMIQIAGDVHGPDQKAWQPPILLTTATTGEGVDELVEALDAHQEYLVSSGQLKIRRRQQLQAEVEAIVVRRAQQRARVALAEETMEAKLAGDPDAVDPRAVADAILPPGRTVG